MQEAIQNGLNEALSGDSVGTAAEIIETHVRDFLAQKFTVSMLKVDNEEVDMLWEQIKKAA